MMANALKLILWALLVNSISGNATSISGSEKENVSFTGGYQYYDNIGYYKLYSLPSTWGYAWKQCKEDGGHLVVINSEEERKVVQDLMENSTRNVFIGVHDSFVEGWFFTVTGKRLLPSSYNKWRDGEPDNNKRRDDGDCVIMNKDGELRDEDCNDSFYFICEVELK